jgi:superfamily II DNA helicase RecQ
VSYPILPPLEPVQQYSEVIDLTHIPSDENSDEYGFNTSDEDAIFQAEAAVLETASSNSIKRQSDEDLKSPRPAKLTRTQESSALSVAKAVLRRKFGMTQFRLKQEAAIGRILNGESAAVVFPTG